MTFEGLQIQGAVKIMEKLTVSIKEKCDTQLSVLLVYTLGVTYCLIVWSDVSTF